MDFIGWFLSASFRYLEEGGFMQGIAFDMGLRHRPWFRAGSAVYRFNVPQLQNQGCGGQGGARHR